ncbi:glycosyl hydrolase family 28-related protein [Planctomycetota bacterium]
MERIVVISLVLFLASCTQADLIQHLDASQAGSVVVDIDDTTVKQWNDLSGEESHAVANRGAVYYPSTSLAGGGLALDFGFERNDLELFDTAETSALLDFSGAAAGNSGFTVFVACRVDEIGQDQDVIGTRHTLGHFAIQIKNDGQMQARLENQLDSEGTLLAAAGDTLVFGFSYEAKTGAYRFWESKNDVVKTGTQLANGDWDADGTLVLGEARPLDSSNSFFRGAIGEVKVYNHTLSSADFKSERESLAEKWADIAPPVAIHWRVIPEDAAYPTDDVIVAAKSVVDRGFAHPLPTDPANSDCTATFQEALDVVSRAGGGTVFVPAGEYRLDGTLTIAENVTLRGRWQEISSERGASGTLLSLYNTGTDPIFNLSGNGCGVRDLTIWHPEQTPHATHPVIYPFVIAGKGGRTTIENITLVNAYRGIDMPKASMCCLRGIYGSPLQMGLTADRSFAVSRFDSIHFSPDYWAWSGLPGSPVLGGPHETYMRSKGLAVNIKEMDGFYFENSTISGYYNGLLYQAGISGDDPHGDMSYLNISNCTYALHVEAAKSFKILGCTFSGSVYGIFSEHNTDMSINTSTIEGGTHAIRTTAGGDFTLVNCTVNGSVNTSGGSLVKHSYDTVMPTFSYEYDAVRKPAKADLFSVKDFGAVRDGATNDAAAFQATIGAAINNGGGIVFVPDGEYVVDGHLNLGIGVELRGNSGGRPSPDSDDELGSLILIGLPGGSETGTPFITLGDYSGVRGLSFHYLDQDYEHFVKHPPMIQGNGQKNYIVDCFGSNPYRAAEFNGDDHLVEYTFFGGLRSTYRANNCSGGRIQNCHIKPDFWRNIEIGNYPATLAEIHATKWRASHQLETFYLNGCENYSISSIFNHATHSYLTVDDSSGQSLMISAEQVQKGYTLRNGSKTFNFLNSSCNINNIGDDSGTYGIKTEPGFKGNACYFVSSLWGTSDPTWDASDGKLYLQQCYVAGPSNRGAINFRCYPGGHIQVESGNSEMRFGLENEGSFTMENFDFRKGCVFSATHDYSDNNLIGDTYILADINQDPPFDYGIALDPSNIVMEEAMIMTGTNVALNNADARRIKGARLTSGSYTLDVTEPAFSDGDRKNVEVEVYTRIDTDCTINVYYHSDSGMKIGKSYDYDGTTMPAWKTVRFSVNDAHFNASNGVDIRIDIVGGSPLLAMVTVQSQQLLEATQKQH